MNPVILIVEDHDALRAAVRVCLGGAFAGARLLEACTGSEALAIACSEQPNAVVVDLRLPEMTGIEATRRIRAECPDTEAVILTGDDTPEYRADAAAAGVKGFVLKHEVHRQLVSALRGMLM